MHTFNTCDFASFEIESRSRYGARSCARFCFSDKFATESVQGERCIFCEYVHESNVTVSFPNRQRTPVQFCSTCSRSFSLFLVHLRCSWLIIARTSLSKSISHSEGSKPSILQVTPLETGYGRRQTYRWLTGDLVS